MDISEELLAKEAGVLAVGDGVRVEVELDKVRSLYAEILPEGPNQLVLEEALALVF